MAGSGSRLMDLVAGWNGQAIVVRRDEPTGAWVFIALHDDTLGPVAGGLRVRVCEQPSEGAMDAMRLAEATTRTWAILGLPFGGATAVLAVPRSFPGERRRGLLDRFGALLETLGGAYRPLQDMGVTSRDMLRLAPGTGHLLGVRRSPGEEESECLDPGPFTARGVLAGMEAALEARTSSRELDGRFVLVQGVGNAGEPLARLLSEAGARVLVSDVDGERASRVAAAVGGRVVAPGDVYDVECDIFAPCAAGGVLNTTTIPHLRCRIVAGAAAGQLQRREDAERLRQRGILYAPDYVVGAGGAAALGLTEVGETDGRDLEGRVAEIAVVLGEIFEEAAERSVSPLECAEGRVAEALARGGRRAEEVGVGC